MPDIKPKEVKYIIKVKPQHSSPASNFLLNETKVSNQKSETDKSEPNQPVKAVPNNNQQACLTAGLNPRYTFETFVVGKHNELAHAACWAAVSCSMKVLL